ncbi:arylsulfatase [Bacteroides sp. GM023]|uniref:arylsulfatase n=1 Tax=Bacteroides sp. GM023 TaxID=2723058 RepID=UPI00168C097B|nr:arylsulfatase [Bacteroides sp. GM023]MBD3588419.1 arylsulfatase [Bacteroides sp. GM023]
MKKQITISSIFTLTALSLQAQNKETPPNIIFILSDDLGYGDLSCMGQTKFSTPNIDKLAEQGIVFTQHYSGSSVSAPSRSCLYTGLHTGHTPIRGNKEVPDGEGQHPLPADQFNVFQLLKKHGYTTGLFGKWGLGFPGSEGDPNNQGIDMFFGYNCQRAAHNYYPYYLWNNQTKYFLDGNTGIGENDYAPYIIHDKAINFIKENKNKPFSLFYTTILPHAELKLPQQEMEPFINQYLPEKVFKGCDDGINYKNGWYGSQKDSHAAFVAMLTLLDKQVGDIMNTLKELNIENNTIIIFTSDNGPHAEGGADPKYFNSAGGLRGIKRDLYEGGIRIPFIAKWPNVIKPGQKTDHISAFWDLLPTVKDILNDKIYFETDGISFLPTLKNIPKQKKHEYLYWEFHEMNGRKAIRKGDWKGVVYNIKGDDKFQLYNLKTDVNESKDIANQHPEIVRELQMLMNRARTSSTIFNFEK